MESTKLLSNAASPWPETELDALSKVHCGGNIAHHPWTVALPSESNDPRSNVDMPSLDNAMQSLPIGDTTADAKTCAIEESIACGVRRSEVSPSLCGNGIETVLLKGSQRPGSGKSSDSHNNNPLEMLQTHSIKLPENACYFNRPSPAKMSMQQDHGHAPSTSIGHEAGVFEAELRKGSKPPGSGQPSPIHNIIPDSETVNRVDVSFTYNGLELLKEPASGGHGQEIGAKKGHGGGSFATIGDSSHLQNILARNTGRAGAGSPSKGHNSIPDGVASE